MGNRTGGLRVGAAGGKGLEYGFPGLGIITGPGHSVLLERRWKTACSQLSAKGGTGTVQDFTYNPYARSGRSDQAVRSPGCVQMACICCLAQAS